MAVRASSLALDLVKTHSLGSEVDIGIGDVFHIAEPQ